MKNSNKKRRIAAALASLSLMSALTMPFAVITASADKVPEITEEISTDETQIPEITENKGSEHREKRSCKAHTE